MQSTSILVLIPIVAVCMFLWSYVGRKKKQRRHSRAIRRMQGVSE